MSDIYLSHGGDSADNSEMQNEPKELKEKTASQCLYTILKVYSQYVTSGSSMGKTNDKLALNCKGAKLLEGKRFQSNISKEELMKWAEDLLR